MSDFNRLEDSEADYLDRYSITADNYCFESSILKDVINSFYRCFVLNEMSKNILHLGSRDGIIAKNLLEADESVSATLIDESESKMNKAKERLKGYNKNNYINAELKEIINGNILEEKFSFIVSSLTINHLTDNQKEDFFSTLYSHLDRNGFFLKIEIMPVPSDSILESYEQLIEQIEQDEINYSDKCLPSYKSGIERYRKLNEVTFKTLYNRLDTLKEIGFRNTSCFYKFGNIAVYSGKK